MIAKSSPSPGIIGILKEALGVSKRCWKIMAAIMLFLLVTFFLLTLALARLSVVPTLAISHTKQEWNGPQSDEADYGDLKFVRILFGSIALYVAAICILSLFALVATVNSSAMAYTKNQFTIKELFSRIWGTWKRAMITWLYVLLFSAAYSFIAFVLIGICMVLAKGLILLGSIVIVSLLGVLLSVYLCVIWMLGIVISVLEDDCYGLAALVRAGELIKGKWLQGFVIMLLLSLLTITIHVPLRMIVGEIKENAVARLSIEIIESGLICLLKLFFLVVYTVFYHKCKAHKETSETAEGFVYSLVTTVEA